MSRFTIDIFVYLRIRFSAHPGVNPFLDFLYLLMSALRKAFLAVVILALICAIAYEILKPSRNSNGLATLKDQSDENAGEQRMPGKFAEDKDDRATDTQLREYAAQTDANIEFIERMPEGESRVSIPLKSALLTTSRTQVQK